MNLNQLIEYLAGKPEFSNNIRLWKKIDSIEPRTVEFPDDLPGDSIGMVTIVAMFQDHGEYGNVEMRQTIQWGIPSDHSLPESHRALWTQFAPSWMVITLSILLAGVWSHYFFVNY